MFYVSGKNADEKNPTRNKKKNVHNCGKSCGVYESEIVN